VTGPSGASKEEMRSVKGKYHAVNSTPQQFAAYLRHLTKQKDDGVMSNAKFRRSYWTAVRRFVKKNGWNPLGIVLGETGLSKAWQTVSRYGWRRLLGKPPRKRRIRGAGSSLRAGSIESSFRTRKGRGWAPPAWGRHL